ncbi:toll/interleukin-1 receptor domain-containing adapter protein [Pseudophryne corroboree]|uniref:toll/interleukin-1 receptor domain-containing adapter protein n=1 Tax=Pseudophryne corroboree TaxID=495146 RepID=UPI003081C93E
MGPKESKHLSPARDTIRSGSQINVSTPGSRTHPIPLQSASARPAEPIPVWPENSARWQRPYDVYICHSKEEADTAYAIEMLSYLEKQPEKLRCFLPLRDMEVGSPVSTEMCRGAESSHCWVMLLTPHFLTDSWCKYQMHQFLTQDPCADGRLIPVVMGLPFSQYPSEMRHMYAFKGTLSDQSVFGQIKRAILTYLKKLLTVTADQVPSVTASSNNSERSEGSSPMRSSGTQESTSDISMRSSSTQESTSDLAMRTSGAQESTTDLAQRISGAQESTVDLAMRTSGTQESTSDISMRSSTTQESTTDLATRTSGTQESTSDISMRSSTTQDSTTDLAMRTSGAQESTGDVAMRGSTTQESTTDLAQRNSGEQESTVDLTRRTSESQQSTSDLSVVSCGTQESISNMSVRISTTPESMSDISHGAEFLTSFSKKVSLNSVTHSSIINQSLSDYGTREFSTNMNCMKNTKICEKRDSKVTANVQERPCNTEVSTASLQDRNTDFPPSLTSGSNKELCPGCSGVQGESKDSCSIGSGRDTSCSRMMSVTRDHHAHWSDMYTSCTGVQAASQDICHSYIDLYTSCSNMQAVSKDTSRSSDLNPHRNEMVNDAGDNSVLLPDQCS